MDKWGTSKSTKLSTNVWVNLLLLHENALKLTQMSVLRKWNKSMQFLFCMDVYLCRWFGRNTLCVGL